MKPLPRDVLLKRIKLLQHQYAEQMLIDDHSRMQRFVAAACRIRTQASEDDIDFVNQHLCRVMVSLGLFASDPFPCPEPRSVAHRSSRVDSSSSATATP